MADALRNALSSVSDAVTDIKAGKFVAVVDDVERENEGDLVCAACFMTQPMMNFLLRACRGLVCAPLTRARAAALGLGLMVSGNKNDDGSAFTITVDCVHGITTGVSALDRAITVRQLANDNMTAKDFSRPGHMFPLIARDNGVLERRGHTEAAVDLIALSGCGQVGVVCEILNDAGFAASHSEIVGFAMEHSLKIITIEQLVQYRLSHAVINISRTRCL